MGTKYQVDKEDKFWWALHSGRAIDKAIGRDYLKILEEGLRPWLSGKCLPWGAGLDPQNSCKNAGCGGVHMSS